jgi:hypothetical protein
MPIRQHLFPTPTPTHIRGGELRKLRIISLAVAGLMVFAAVAFALQENTYTVQGSVSPLKTGTKKKPKPVSLGFGYKVAEKSGKRPALIKKYSIHFAGLQVNTNFFKGCSAAKIDAAQSDAGCPKGSLMGTGAVENATGSTNNEADRSLSCHLDLKLYNSRNNKAAIYLHGEQSSDPAKNCPLAVDKAIDATFVRNSTGTALQFTVDETLLHPAPGFDNAVVLVKSSVRRATTTVKGKTRGWFESWGRCINKKRAITVTFTPANGTPSQKAQRLAACST